MARTIHWPRRKMRRQACVWVPRAERGLERKREWVVCIDKAFLKGSISKNIHQPGEGEGQGGRGQAPVAAQQVVAALGVAPAAASLDDWDRNVVCKIITTAVFLVLLGRRRIGTGELYLFKIAHKIGYLAWDVCLQTFVFQLVLSAQAGERLPQKIVSERKTCHSDASDSAAAAPPASACPWSPAPFNTPACSHSRFLCWLFAFKATNHSLRSEDVRGRKGPLPGADLVRAH